MGTCLCTRTDSKITRAFISVKVTLSHPGRSHWGVRDFRARRRHQTDTAGPLCLLNTKASYLGVNMEISCMFPRTQSHFSSSRGEASPHDPLDHSSLWTPILSWEQLHKWRLQQVGTCAIEILTLACAMSLEIIKGKSEESQVRLEAQFSNLPSGETSHF